MTRVIAVFPIFLVACGGLEAELDEVAEQPRAVTTGNGQTQNGQTQNGQTQNGQTQNGGAYGVAGADLRNGVTRLSVVPAPGANPSPTATGSLYTGVSLSQTALQGIGASPLGFQNTLIPAKMTNGEVVKLWVEKVIAPAADPELWHYQVKAYHLDQTDNSWLCAAYGVCRRRWDYICGTVTGTALPVAATAIPGQWDYNKGYAGAGGKIVTSASADYGKLITFACPAGAIGKCVEKLGYKPWKLGPRECFSTNKLSKLDCMRPTLEMAHEACVRMIRADYCGDGQTHTINGIMVDNWDNRAVNTETPYSSDPAVYSADPPAGVPFGYEAEWTPRGARCVSQMLMPRTSHQGAGVTVQRYLEDPAGPSGYCADKWKNADGSTYVWSSGDCFGRGPTQSTFYRANVPWNLAQHKPAMDLRDRVYLRNSSVCISDEFVGLAPHNNLPNPMKTSPAWVGMCLP